MPEPEDYAAIKIAPRPLVFKRPVARATHRLPMVMPGNGYLAGEHPGGTTTVDGVPQSAQVRVVVRDPKNGPYDGFVAARAHSAPDGTWRVDGLNPNLRYDVIGRKDGFNDVIVSNVQPVV